MFFTLLLVGALSAPLQSQGAGSSSTADAAQLEGEGRYEEAISVLERQVSANPDDHRARLAIARLQERMGHAARAEAVYRSVLLEDETNVDAMLGVATTLLAQGAANEALDVLRSAESVAPRRAEVLAALGQAHQQAGNTGLALPYLELAAASSPTIDNRLKLEAARRMYQNRVESLSVVEDFSGTTATARTTDLSVNLRLTDTLRILGRGQIQRKFGATDERGGGGLEWRWRPTTTLVGHALIGSNNTVLADRDYLGEIRHRHGSTMWTGSVRFFDFPGLRMTFFSPGVTWQARERLSLDLRYWLSVTDTVGETPAGHTAHIRAAYALRPRVWVHLGYASGVDTFENFSIDRTGAFHARTGLAGVRVELASLTSIIGTFEHQSRKTSPDTRRFTLSLAQRF